MNPLSIARLSLCALLPLLSTGCNLKKDKILGRCDKTEEGSYAGNSRRCTDAYARSHLKSCTGKNEKAADEACKRDDAVAGCKQAEITEWFYNDGDKGYATVESVGKYCLDIANGTTILPDGGAVLVKTADERAGDELKKNLAEHGPRAKAALGTVAAIAAKLPAPTGKLDLQGLAGDALVVHKEDLGDLENPKKLDYRLDDTDKLAACSRILGNRKKKSDAAYELEYCAKRPLLAIISVSSYAQPVATGTSVSGNTKTTYVKKGRISGDVLLFRMDSGKPLGSVPFAVANDDDSATLPQIMTEHLLAKFPSALHTTLKAAAPGVTNLRFELEKK